MVDPEEFVLYEGSEDWSALYRRGELIELGDHYWVQERLLSALGVPTIQSDDFLRGGDTRGTAARTLEELEEYRRSREFLETQAAELEAQAEELRAQAAELSQQASEIS